MCAKYAKQSSDARGLLRQCAVAAEHSAYAAALLVAAARTLYRSEPAALDRTPAVLAALSTAPDPAMCGLSKRRLADLDAPDPGDQPEENESAHSFFETQRPPPGRASPDDDDTGDDTAEDDRPQYNCDQQCSDESCNACKALCGPRGAVNAACTSCKTTHPQCRDCLACIQQGRASPPAPTPRAQPPPGQQAQQAEGLAEGQRAEGQGLSAILAAFGPSAPRQVPTAANPDTVSSSIAQALWMDVDSDNMESEKQEMSIKAEERHRLERRAKAKRKAAALVQAQQELNAKETAGKEAEHEVIRKQQLLSVLVHSSCSARLTLAASLWLPPSLQQRRVKRIRRDAVEEHMAKFQAAAVSLEERGEKQKMEAATIAGQMTRVRNTIVDDGGCRSLRKPGDPALRTRSLRCRYALNCPVCCFAFLSFEGPRPAGHKWHRPGALCRECVTKMCPELIPQITQANADYVSAMHEENEGEGDRQYDGMVGITSDADAEFEQLQNVLKAEQDGRADALRVAPETARWFDQHPNSCAAAPASAAASQRLSASSCSAAQALGCGMRCCGGFVAQADAMRPTVKLCSACFRYECAEAGVSSLTLSVTPTPSPTLSYEAATAKAKAAEMAQIREQKAKVGACRERF